MRKLSLDLVIFLRYTVYSGGEDLKYKVSADWRRRNGNSVWEIVAAHGRERNNVVHNEKG